MIKKNSSFFLQILKVWLFNTWLANLLAMIFIQRLFTLSVSFWLHGLHLLPFNTDCRPQRVGSRKKWRHLLTSLKFQLANAAYYICKTRVWKPQTPVLHINSAASTRIAFLNYSVFDVIFSSIQLSQDFRVSNGGKLNRKILVKINRCLFWNQS